MGRTATVFAWPVLAAALAAAVAWLVWSIATPEAAGEAVTYRDQMAARGAAAPVADLAAAARDSVYLVTVELPSGRRSPVGTAFVVQRPGGTKALATSARVADLFRRQMQADPDLNGARMIAAQPRPPDYPAVRIAAVEIHPAWDALGQVSGGNAYDVALLVVDDPARLGPPLDLARQSALETLKAGDPLVLVGYLGADLGDSDLTRPIPASAAGIATALTTFRGDRGIDADNLLIQVALPGAPVAAGSPLLNAAGAVVGVFDAGDPAGLLDGTPHDTPARRLVTFGARADCLAALLAGTAADGLAELVDDWARPAPDPVDQLKARAKPGDTVTLVFDADGAPGAGNAQFPGAKAVWFDVKLPGPGLYLAVIRSLSGQSVLAVIDDADGRIAEIGTAGAAISTAMVRVEAAAALKIGAIGEATAPVHLQLYRAAPPGL